MYIVYYITYIHTHCFVISICKLNYLDSWACSTQPLLLQATRSLRYDTAIDMWSFGCILAECHPQSEHGTCPLLCPVIKWCKSIWLWSVLLRLYPKGLKHSKSTHIRISKCLGNAKKFPAYLVHVGYASPQIYWWQLYGAYGAWIFRLYTGYPLFPGENEVGAKDGYPDTRVVLWIQSDPGRAACVHHGDLWSQWHSGHFGARMPIYLK